MGLFGGPNVEKLAAKRDLKGLAKALTDDDAGTRRSAARALGEIDDPAAVPYIVEQVSKQKDEQAIVDGMGALRAMGTAVTALAAGMREGDMNHRTSYIAAMGRVGAPALAPLLEASSDDDPSMRAPASLSLGMVGGPDATKRLITIFNEDDEIDVRGMAMVGIANNKLDGAFDTFMASLTGGAEPVDRALGAMGLGTLGDRAASVALDKAAAEDDDERVRSAAAKALAELQS
jgi:HEAT repeat protein